MKCSTDCGVELTGTEDSSICDDCWDILYNMGYGQNVTNDNITEEVCNNLKKVNGVQKKSTKKNKKFKHFVGPTCTHVGMPLVFEIGEGKVYASGERDQRNWDLNLIDLIVSLNGHQRPIFKMNSKAKELIDEYLYINLQPQEEHANISIEWSDGGAPPFDVEYVKDLVEFVRSGNSILIHCFGGHGRTGTLLAAMLHETNGPGRDIIKWLRKNYCKKAVETNSQIEWLKSTYGMKTKEKPIWGGTSTYMTPGAYGAGEF